MILHYLKIAFRNLWKYKNQTLISVLGLTVGFTCFALATLWVRYEMTYDSFYKNAAYKYLVYQPSRDQTGYGTRSTPVALANYLKETFPEIANAVSLSPPSQRTVAREGVEYQAHVIQVDSSFLRMFDVKIIEGTPEFLLLESPKVAITEKKARQLFGKENPIGKTISFGINYQELEICAIVSGMAKQSSYPYDIIQSARWIPNPNYLWNLIGHTMIELYPGTDVEAFEKKLNEIELVREGLTFRKMTIKPLTKLRYSDPEIAKEVKFQHLMLFALSGLLVVLCSMFNYLTLFISRFRIRQKELALRMVCGASGSSLLVMLTVEFLTMLLFAVLLGCGLTHIGYRPFLAMSAISMNLSAIYRESLLYIGGVITVSLLAFWLILIIFRHRGLNLSIRRSNKNLFRKTSVVVQLVISIGFAFCAIVMLKQMQFLFHTDELGFSFKNRGSIMVWGNDTDIFVDRLKQIPEVTDVVYAKGVGPLLPQSGRGSREINTWDDKSELAENITVETMDVSPAYNAFYGFKLVAGEWLTDSDPETLVLINESAAKAFGWHDPVGKNFDNKFTVKGVIKNVYNFAPTIQIKPVIHQKSSPDRESAYKTSVTMYSDGTRIEGVRTYGRYVLFRYHEGMWKTCKEKIDLLKDEFTIESINNTEEVYYDYLKSEKVLLKLISIVSGICIVICVFGFVSLVSLTCQERRKSIAIRKINGATTGDILLIFAKEYILLLMTGAAIAFSVGYIIMQRWIEQYVKQTGIPVWVYVSIIFGLASVIVLCVGWQVYKSSTENPAETVKSDN